VVIATSQSPEDDAIESVCQRVGVDCFRGSLENVLDRFYLAAERNNPNHVVRLNGDCPLSDLEVIDEVIEFYFASECDYAAN
jgi:spore coat polysaccharide biosynthesis protein SpsF (cytidylyltransferase family)